MTIELFSQLEASLNTEVLERSSEIHTAILSLVAKRHHFQLGVPGTAKSLLVTRLAKKINGLPDDGYFHYLLTQFTVPAELYGPPNLLDLKNGIYHLNTEGKLPKAYIAFLDEIFKGNSSILNANLTIMNERKFINAMDNPNVPLLSIFAASNELPQGDNLNALWDRLHFRHEVEPLQETSNFVQMLQNNSFDDEPIVSLADIQRANEAIKSIVLSNNCFEAILAIRADLEAKGITATERRWRDCIPIIQAEAWLRGLEVADISCLTPLTHVLWSSLDHRKIVEGIILNIASPLDKEATELLDKLVALLEGTRKKLNENLDQKQKSNLAIEVNQKINQGKAQYKKLKKAAEEADITSPIIKKVGQLLVTIGNLLVSDVLGLDPATSAAKL